MPRRGSKYVVVVRSLNDLTQIKNNVDKIKEELNDHDQVEVRIAKSGKYMLTMSISKTDVQFMITTDDMKQKLPIRNKDDAMAIQKLLQFALSQLF